MSNDDDNPLEEHLLEAQHKRLENDRHHNQRHERSKLINGRVEDLEDRDLVYLAMTLLEGCGCCAINEVGDPDWKRLAKELVERLEAVV